MANEIKTDEILELFDKENEKSGEVEKEKTARVKKSSEQSNKKSGKKHKKRKRAHPWAFPLGLAIAVLSVIGAVSILVAGAGTVKRALLKVKNIDEYNRMLVPVVMNDPNTFDDLSKADMNQLIDISIWAILKSDLSPDTYQYNDSGMVIPESDVNKQFEKLFGKNISPVHSTVTGFGYEFTYDAAGKCYTIPLTGVAPVYTPDVVSIEKKSNTVVLTVAYLAANGWAQDSNGKMVAPSPDKYVKITLRQGDTGYYISAVQATSTPETAVAEPITAIVEPTTETPTELIEIISTTESVTETTSSFETTTAAETTTDTENTTETTEATTEAQTSIE